METVLFYDFFPKFYRNHENFEKLLHKGAKNHFYGVKEGVSKYSRLLISKMIVYKDAIKALWCGSDVFFGRGTPKFVEF